MSNGIRFLHLRQLNTKPDEKTGSFLALKGGKTIAYRVDDNGVLEYVVARCGNNENYNRKRGAMIAGGRLQCQRQTTQTKYVKTVVVANSDLTAVETLVELEG